MALYLLPQPLREGDRGIEHGTGQNEKEFLSPVTADAVDLPRLVLQELRDFLEHGISGLVAELVVYALELVDVAHDERDGFVEPHRALPHLMQAVFQAAPVVDLGKSVGKGYPQQLVVEHRQL